MTDDTSSKHATQGMADDGPKGAPDGTGIPTDTRGAGGGGPIGPKDSGGSHGGQSNAAYHGHGQLGEDKVEGQDNDNGVSRDP